jgi:hypothetical protein
MKYSKQIPIWERKKLWDEFIKYRKSEFKNFETFLKHTLNEH